MTSRLPAQCLYCAHFASPIGAQAVDDGDPLPSCRAFPDGIPDAIWWNRADHRRYFPDDRNVRWEPAEPGIEYPDWVMDGSDADLTATSGVNIVNIAPQDVDLSQVQADWEAHLDDLLAAWVDITADQRAEIISQVRSAISRDDVAALAVLHVSTAAATAALMAAMTEMAVVAAERMAAEAAAQDVTVEPTPPEGSVLAPLAAALAILLAQGLTNAGAREALRRYNPQADPDEVVDAVQEHLEGLSDAFLRDNLGGALTAAQNAGRMQTMLAGPSAAIYGSEQMDRRTCPPCRKINGKWIGNSDDPDIEAKVAAVYPSGGYRDCEGGIRCRGTMVAVYRPEQVRRGS